VGAGYDVNIKGCQYVLNNRNGRIIAKKDQCSLEEHWLNPFEGIGLATANVRANRVP